MTYFPFSVDSFGNVLVNIASSSGTVATTQSGSWSITANAGTNLNTSLLALESGGNLASIKTNTDNISTRLSESTFTTRINTLGSKTSANSTPVVIASDQSAIPISGSIAVTTSAASSVIVSGRDQALVQDSFGRLEVSDAVNIFSCKEDIQQQTRYWSTLTATGGAVNYSSTTSSNTLSVTTSSGSRAVRQSKAFFPYSPGKGSSVVMTGVMGTGQANTVKRIGLFDDNNGLFFELNGTTKNVVIRSNVSGSVVDTRIPQASWNIDTFEGSGPSGVTMDWSKAEIFGINFQWLGVGRVLFYFIVQGKIFACHQVFNANVISDVFMRTPLLPLRYEIVNTGAAAGASSLKQICAVIQSDGLDDYGQYFSCNNGTTTKAVNGLIPILQMRAKSTSPNPPFQLKDVEVMTTSANYLYWQLALNPTVTGGTAASYTSVNSSSYFEYDVAASGAVTAGQILMSGYLTSQTRISSHIDLGVDTNLIGTDINGNRDVLCLAMATVGGGASQCLGALSWIEFA